VALRLCRSSGLLGTFSIHRILDPDLTYARSIVGATLGGTLAQPVKNFPSIFRPGSIFDIYPFLLPNLVCTGFVFLGVVFGILFLEETHADKKDRRDIGLELGQWILRKLGFGSEQPLQLDDDESAAFLPREKQNSDLEADGQPSALELREIEVELPDALARHPIKAYSWRETFNNQVMLNILALGVLALYVFIIIWR
jgi:hypothetical protein